MGVSISIHTYEIDKLLTGIEREVDYTGLIPPRELIPKIMDYFGTVEGNKFYVLWNEYYEQYNAGCNFIVLIQKYYNNNNIRALWGYVSDDGGGSIKDAWEDLIGTPMPESLDIE